MEIELNGQKFKSEKERDKYCYYHLNELENRYKKKYDKTQKIVYPLLLFLIILPVIIFSLIGADQSIAVLFLFPPIVALILFSIFYRTKQVKEIISWAENYEENFPREIDKHDKEIEKEKRMIQEYERKCNKCGTIWHCLVSEEKNLISQGKSNALIGLGNIGSPTGAFFSNKSIDISNKLKNLRKCPKCGSQDYSEKITKFEKK